jgi:hypothetical protein
MLKKQINKGKKTGGSNHILSFNFAAGIRRFGGIYSKGKVEGIFGDERHSDRMLCVRQC